MRAYTRAVLKTSTLNPRARFFTVGGFDIWHLPEVVGSSQVQRRVVAHERAAAYVSFVLLAQQVDYRAVPDELFVYKKK